MVGNAEVYGREPLATLKRLYGRLSQCRIGIGRGQGHRRPVWLMVGGSMRKYLIGATVAAASGLMALSIPAAQATGAGGEQPPPGVVSATPASGTPHLKASDDSPPQQIRQLVQCGNTMYAVGSFSEIIKGSTTYTRENVFSFSATKP